MAPVELMIKATAPASKTSLRFTWANVCRLKSIPSKAKRQNLNAAEDSDTSGHHEGHETG
jgi:hypothetical protein